MKLSDLLEAKVPGPRNFGPYVPSPHYNAKEKMVKGPVALWMDQFNITKEDLIEARKQARELPSFKELITYSSEITSPTQERNGMFAFRKPEHKNDTLFYTVAANGQVRYDEKKSSSGASRGKLASPAPVNTGDPVKTLIKIYDNSFKRIIELLRKKIIKSLTQIVEKYKTGNVFNCSKNELKTLVNSPAIPSSLKNHFDCSKNQLPSLKGGPLEVWGDYECYDNHLSSLEGSPSYVKGIFQCGQNRITSLEGAPSDVDGFYAAGNRLSSLKNIHKIIKKADKFSLTGNPIRSHVLGVLLVEGCTTISLDNKEVEKIIKKYLPNKDGMKGVLKCQEELFAANLDDYAQL